MILATRHRVVAAGDWQWCPLLPRTVRGAFVPTFAHADQLLPNLLEGRYASGEHPLSRHAGAPDYL
jgi:hypothetical protein